MKKLDIKSLAANNPNGLATFFDAARAVNPARLIESGTFDVSYSGVNIKGSVDRTGFIKELVKSGRFAQEIDRNEIVNSLSAPEICYAKKVTSKAGSIWFVPQIVAKDPTIGPGYGMNINSRKNEVFVTALVKDSPAERAGIACGDEIETVNGLDISKLDMAAIADVFKRSSAVVLECKTVDGQPKTFHLIKPTK